MFYADTYIKKFNDLMTLRELTPNTAKSYNSMLRMFLDWCGSCNKAPEDISFEETRNYIFHLKQVRKLTPRSINAHISQIRFLFLYVVHRSWNQYEVPFLKYCTTLPDILTREEANGFIESIPNIKHKAIVAIMYSAGLRVSEVCHLRYADVDRKNMRIYISHSKSRSDRYAILSKKALNILTEYWFSCGRPRDWLFPSTHKSGSNPIVNFTVERFVSDHLKRLGWHRKVSCHLFRHSFGTHLYEAGYDLLSIQKLLGHKSASSSLIYISLGAKTMSALKSPFDFGGGA